MNLLDLYLIFKERSSTTLFRGTTNLCEACSSIFDISKELLLLCDKELSEE
jgi:hypothetical protein